MGFAWPGFTHCEYCGRNLGLDFECNCEESKKHREYICGIYSTKRNEEEEKMENNYKPEAVESVDLLRIIKNGDMKHRNKS